MKYYTSEQASEMLKITKVKLHRLARAVGLVKIGRAYKFTRRDIYKCRIYNARNPHKLKHNKTIDDLAALIGLTDSDCGN